MTQVQLQELQKQLWNIANTLRGKMGADEFRDYILGLIFYKYLSEKVLNSANAELADEGIEFPDLDASNEEHQEFLEALKQESLENMGYFLEPNQLFHSIAVRAKKEKEFILDDLINTFNSIEQSTQDADSADDFAHLFEDLDLTSTKLGNNADDRNELIAKVIVHLDAIDFDISNTESDVLGDAYEYLIGEFASGAGKKAGEFYTPQMVSTLLARIVTQGKERLRSVYDPTCGSGSLLLRVKREVGNHVDAIYGQEMNRTTYNLARMNMILHDVHFSKFDIRQEDTLKKPQHLDKKFGAIVANPPFSAKWSADPLFMNDERFKSYGKLAPSSKADMAFVQHMLYQLDEHGTMAVVLPHGVLFRGSSEGHIRQFMIEQMNVIDTIIGLPANIFYGTSIPTCILVLKKNREHKDNILFIDASNEFEKQKNQNKLLPEHLDNIIGAYENRQNIDKYAHVATLQEVKDNDFNLNIPRYVDTFEADDEIDLDAIAQALQALELKSQKTDAVINGFCKELGIASPFAEVK